MPVNIAAPYLLTALIDRPQRLIYLSSGAHRSGRASLDGVDWSGRTAGSYSDSKLFVTTLAATVARIWPDVFTDEKVKRFGGVEELVSGDGLVAAGAQRGCERLLSLRIVGDRRFSGVCGRSPLEGGVARCGVGVLSGR